MLVLFSACRKVDVVTEETDTPDTPEYADWTESTHGSDVSPNYSVVFEQNNVLRFDIVIDSDDWAEMQTDLNANLGSTGGGPGGGGPGGGGGTTTSSTDFDPIWRPCSFNFDDKEWYDVGIRFKGNSSLQSAYQSGNNKLSLKLDFNQFAEDYPALEDQRFYGFKQLNLNNNYDDASLMREKVGADLFRAFGLVSPQTTFCVIYLDNGSGSQYYGVYTIVEEVDDTVLEDQFNDDNGNLYKPDGDAATFAQGTYDEGELEKKTNEDFADYGDVEALYDIINSSERTSNTEQWKTNLSEIFDVDTFLKWLAANTVMQNWDTYGNMTHNYFLYNNPDNSKLTWIPWDNNEALQDGKLSGALNLDLDDVNSSWPLIRYLMNVEDYELIYQNYVQQFVDEVFIPADMISTYESYYSLLKEYAYLEESGFTYLNNDSDFDQAVTTLKSHVQSRNTAVDSYLN